MPIKEWQVCIGCHDPVYKTRYGTHADHVVLQPGEEDDEESQKFLRQFKSNIIKVREVQNDNS